MNFEGLTLDEIANLKPDRSDSFSTACKELTPLTDISTLNVNSQA
jgi:hypothetical protein